MVCTRNVPQLISFVKQLYWFPQTANLLLELCYLLRFITICIVKDSSQTVPNVAPSVKGDIFQ